MKNIDLKYLAIQNHYITSFLKTVLKNQATIIASNSESTKDELYQSFLEESTLLFLERFEALGFSKDSLDSEDLANFSIN